MLTTFLIPSPLEMKINYNFFKWKNGAIQKLKNGHPQDNMIICKTLMNRSVQVKRHTNYNLEEV